MPKIKDIAKVLQSSTTIQLKRISANVWKITDTVYADLELLMNAGFFNGMSAKEISKFLTQYLNNPQFLTEKQIKKKIENEQITESQAAKYRRALYSKIGRGVYRNPLKNAERLARTEINNAYHNKDYENRQKNTIYSRNKSQFKRCPPKI